MMAHPLRTEKLYLDDSYTVQFEASVLSCVETDEGPFNLVLNKSYFYPESGGQLADRGRVGDVEVTHVWEEADGAVFHGVGRRVAPGRVKCEIDWPRRFDHMQQHTGQHVLSRAFIEVGGLHTVSFHMGEESCTIDVEGGALDDALIEKAEDLTNAVIMENREVIVRTVARAELDDASLRKSLPQGVTEVRLVEVEGFDAIGCCGTHVRRTGELAIVKVLKHEKTRGAWRIHFIAGKRALEDFKSKHEIVKRLANRFTAAVDDVGGKVEKLQAEALDLRKNLQKASRRLAAFEARALLDGARVHGGRRYVVEVLAEASDDYVKLIAAEIRNQENTIGILGTAQGWVLCNASGDLDVDLAQRVVGRGQALGGSGGGKGGFASVRLPATVAVGEFLEAVFNDVKEL